MFHLSHTAPDLTIEPETPVISIRGITLKLANRPHALNMKISLPVTGETYGVVILSHGHGSSMDGYAPLADYWSSNGYIVIQPTHLDAYRLGISKDHPVRNHMWLQRIEDIKAILDHLGDIENAYPQLKGRLTSAKIVMAGHSFGGQTTEMLLGARMQGNAEMSNVDMSDTRIHSGILFAAGGEGGNKLSDIAKEHLPYLNMEFSQMTTPFMSIVGDHDDSVLSVAGPEWFYDPYLQAPGAQVMLKLFQAEHMLGGISGYAVNETTDENPQRVATIQKMTLAYLDWRLKGDSAAWISACKSLHDERPKQGEILIKKAESL